jgi:hypothetical protein
VRRQGDPRPDVCQTVIGKHLVKPELAPTELGRALNQVEHIRLLADYTGEAIDADKVVWAINQADTFLKCLASALP